MGSAEKKGAIYSEHKAPKADLVGLFARTPFIPAPEDEILDSITKGSKYKRHNIVAVGFGKTTDNGNLEIEALYLTFTGFLESDHQRYVKNYQRLQAMSLSNHRLIHHLRDPRILALNPEEKKERPLPYYFELDSDRVLALYLSR
ncbi:MAG: hypothetical protein WC402_03255 [Candidatus Pacearchaeota archaeon]|jgi:hypothetical protein